MNEDKPVPPKNRPLVRRYCLHCNAMLGSLWTEGDGISPLCESCGEALARIVYKREERDRAKFADWLQRIREPICE